MVNKMKGKSVGRRLAELQEGTPLFSLWTVSGLDVTHNSVIADSVQEIPPLAFTLFLVLR